MLDQGKLSAFETDGYIVIENVVGEATLAAVRTEYEELMDRLYRRWHRDGLLPEPPDGLSFWDKIDRCTANRLDWFQPLDICLPSERITAETPMHFGPAVFDLVTDRNILDIVETLIGPEIMSNPIQHVRIKPPENEVPADETRSHIISTDWHQDRSAIVEEADITTMVTVWIAITDATVENGCLQVASGNYDKLLQHCASGNHLGLASAHTPQNNAVPLPVNAGGVVIFHPLTPHSSLSNRSGAYRWSFDLRYHVTGQPSGRGQFPDFVARSRANPGSELRDWRQWLGSWEAARARLATIPHIPQYRWDSDAPGCA